MNTPKKRSNYVFFMDSALLLPRLSSFQPELDIAALSASGGLDRIARRAFHADLLVEDPGLCFWKSCHIKHLGVAVDEPIYIKLFPISKTYSDPPGTGGTTIYICNIYRTSVEYRRARMGFA